VAAFFVAFHRSALPQPHPTVLLPSLKEPLADSCCCSFGVTTQSRTLQKFDIFRLSE
jgi:hypothetical protein